MGDNRVNKTVTLKPDCLWCQVYDVQPGTYEVFVGDWGWDDGDLYIITENKGRVKTKYLGVDGVEYG